MHDAVDLDITALRDTRYQLDGLQAPFNVHSAVDGITQYRKMLKKLERGYCLLHFVRIALPTPCRPSRDNVDVGSQLSAL